MDKVEEILSQWRTQRPDLDVTAMGTIGRVSRVSGRFSAAMNVTFAKHGINAAAFDVLATLRRAGTPYRKSIGELMDWMMISSGSTTNRIQKLERARLIERVADENDARKAFVQLTTKGLKKIDEVVVDHVNTQAALVDCLTEQERISLEQILTKIESCLGSGPKTR